MAICPYCGAQIGDEARICGFCGGKLTLDFTEVPETVAREIPGAESVFEGAGQIPEPLAEDEYEGIPDDILGSVLGALPGRHAAPKAEEIPAAPEPGTLPEIPTVDEILNIPAIDEIPAAPAVEEAPVIPAVEEIPEVPAVEEIPEARVVEEIPEIPAVEEIPEIPVVEEAPEIPAVKEIPETPAAEEAPVIPAAEQPVYAQPVSAEPAGKKPKWLLPAAIVAALALIGILIFALRGGGGSKASDPNVGVYKATLVEMYGLQLDPDEIYDNGFVIELKDDGVCTIRAGGQPGKGTWSMEDDIFTVDDGQSKITGTLSDGVMKLENMLDLGLDITLEKQE